VLAVFFENGFSCTGLELSRHRIEYAQKHSPAGIRFISGDVETFNEPYVYDVVLMLDVIEHLDNKIGVLNRLRAFLKTEGILIISFPPIKSAFGGHQQVMSSFLQYIPFIHLLPQRVYRWLLEHIEKKNVESHFRNYLTGLTIQDFEKLVDHADLKIRQKIFYFVRPRQAFRFGIKIRLNRIPIFKEYLNSGAIYVLTRRSPERQVGENGV